MQNNNFKERRKYKNCPKCGNGLLAREGKFIFCLMSNCDWAIQSKRSEDKNIKTIGDIKKDWGE